MFPIFCASVPYTAVPSTLSLPIRFEVSLSSIAMCALPVVGKLPTGRRIDGSEGNRDGAALTRSMMHDGEWHAADFVTLFVGDEHGVMLVLQLRQALEQAS